MKLKINEIYKSIQGESTYVGLPTIFIRTSGCPLRCSFCDSSFAFYEGSQMSIDQILQKVSQLKTSYICVTGGEPLIQKNIYKLMNILCDQNYHVSLETSGARSCQKVDHRVKKIIDVKTPDSGAKNTFLLENLDYLNNKDEIKFVICSQKDFNWSIDFLKKHHLPAKIAILFSPSHDEVTAQWLAENILSANFDSVNLRMQIQIHKYIWDKNTRKV